MRRRGRLKEGEGEQKKGRRGKNEKNRKEKGGGERTCHPGDLRLSFLPEKRERANKEIIRRACWNLLMPPPSPH